MKDCSNTHVTYDLVLSAQTVLTVSIGNTPASVFLAIANLPLSPTAFHPPNSWISLTLPFLTFRAFPKVSISWIFLLFSIKFGKFFNSFDNVSKLASAAGAVYVWLAAGSVSVVAASVRNGLFVSKAFPLRSSLEPEFAIELDSEDFSVFVALIPTVAFPFVGSTAGASFFSSGFVFSCVVAVTSLLYALVNSSCVFALSNIVLTVPNSTFNLETLSSVLESYTPEAIFDSISTIKELSFVLSKVIVSDLTTVSLELFPTIFPVILFSSVAEIWFTWSWILVSAAAADPCPKYIKNAATATEVAPKLAFLIE